MEKASNLEAENSVTGWGTQKGLDVPTEFN